MVRTNWSADPWARGSYSYLPTGASPELRAKLAVPVGGRLFFAGEATDDGDPGTVHGAQASGRRVAGHVAAAANAGDSVLIVGAGMAGLTAAFELTAGRFAAERYRVSVVEARDRIGGRIDSMKPRGHTMFAERGASWVHAADPQPELAGARRRDRNRAVRLRPGDPGAERSAAARRLC